MKKLTYVLGFLFVAAIGITAFATVGNDKNDTKTCAVDQRCDEKPCPEGCTCAKCEKAKAEGKTGCSKDAKADCSKETKADCKKEAKCDKGEKKSCCASKDASKTEGATEQKTESEQK